MACLSKSAHGDTENVTIRNWITLSADRARGCRRIQLNDGFRGGAVFFSFFPAVLRANFRAPTIPTGR